MVGVQTRKINQTRGNKMGNDAFIRDDVATNEYSLINNICKYIMENCDDSSFIDFFKSLKYNNDNSYNIVDIVMLYQSVVPTDSGVEG